LQWGDGGLRKLLNRIEKYLIRGVVLGLVTLVVIQAMLTQNPMRFYLSWGERLEGQQMEYPASLIGEEEALQPQPAPEEAVSPWGKMTISLEDYSSLARVKVLVNDKEVATFQERQVKLEVMAGDVVEIDTSFYDFPIEFKISSVSSNLAAPSLNQCYNSNQGIVMIGKVVVK
jgi:hypothetical protein